MNHAIPASEVSLSELIAGVFRRWRIVSLIVIVAICFAAVRIAVVTPQYEARASLIVLAPNQAVTDLQTLQLYRNLVPAYREILSSRRVMYAVLSELKLDWSPEEYRARIRIEANEETQTLNVFVRTHSPTEAAQIATGAAEIMTRVAADIMQDERLVLLDRATPPEKPVSPRPTLEITLAAMLGVIAGSGVALVLEMSDRRIRDEATVEKRLGLPVLGVIPHIEL